MMSGISNAAGMSGRRILSPELTHLFNRTNLDESAATQQDDIVSFTKKVPVSQTGLHVDRVDVASCERAETIVLIGDHGAGWSAS